MCGNLSTGDGGGVAHFGFINDGNIANNWMLFNQSTNPTCRPTAAVSRPGGRARSHAGRADATECGTTTDQDCPPGLSRRQRAATW